MTLMNKEEAKKYFKGSLVYKSNLQLVTFNKSQVQIVGYISVNVQYSNKDYKLNIYLTNVKRSPIVGREWLRQIVNIENSKDFFCRILNNNEINTVDSNYFDVEVNKLLHKYSNVLKTDLSKIHNLKATLTLKENYKPVFIRARPLPFKLIPLVNKELDLLESEGVLEKINTSDNATPIVPVLKSNNRVRICGDFSITINPQIIIDDYHLPTVDELFSDMSGCCYFSKLDLREAYMQLELAEESQKLLTLNTHRGLYRCKRMWYGVA